MNLFAHESTPAYQQALEFAKWCEPLLDRTPKPSALHSQFDHVRTTILLKVAAGAGRLSPADRNFEAAATAAVECAACLDLLFNKRVVSREELQRGKDCLLKLIALLDANAAAPESRAQAA